MDVRMLGDGRPFVLEIEDARIALEADTCAVRLYLTTVGLVFECDGMVLATICSGAASCDQF
jgi:hypothetical protein